jgi:hypothetical protein
MPSSFLLDQFVLAACAPAEEATTKQAAKRVLALTDSATLAKIAGEMEKEGRALCIPDPDNKGWLDRFVGTPLFDQAVALQQAMLQHDSEYRQKEQQVTDLRKKLQVDWEDRRAVEDQLDLQRQMLDLQLAQFNNAQITQPEEVQPATLGQVASTVEPAAKTASPLRSGALLGGLVGAGVGAATADPNTSFLDAAAKGGFAGAALGGAAGHLKGLRGKAPAPAAAAPAAMAKTEAAAVHPAIAAQVPAASTGGAATRSLRPGLDKTVTDTGGPRLTQYGSPSPAALAAPQPGASPSNTIQASPLAHTNSPLASSLIDTSNIPGVVSKKVSPDNAQAILSRLGWQPDQPLPALLR